MTRNNLEHDKFQYVWWKVAVKLSQGNWSASIIGQQLIDNLEHDKFTNNNKIRVITTF